MIFQFWGPKVVTEFLHQYKVSLTNVFMLVIRTKYQYQYLYIQKITHVLSNIHRKKHFHVSNTHITKKQYTHKHRNMHCHHHQNQERALASRLPSPLKPNTKTLLLMIWQLKAMHKARWKGLPLQPTLNTFSMESRTAHDD